MHVRDISVTIHMFCILFSDRNLRIYTYVSVDTCAIHVVHSSPHLGHFGQVLLHPLPPFPTRANELGTVVPSSFPLPSRVAVVRSIRDGIDLEPLERRPALCSAGPLVATAAVGARGWGGSSSFSSVAS